MNDIDRLAWTLLHFVWQGTLIAALYALARQCTMRRTGPNARYLLAWTALALMSAAPIVTWIALRPAAPVSTIQAGTIPASSPTTPIDSAANVPALAASHPAFVPAAMLPWIAALWCAGALLFWMRLTLGWLFAARLRQICVSPPPGEWQAQFAHLQTRLRVSRPVRLLVSARVTAPATVGWLRPVVLAPACAFTGLAPGQLEAVLLHELAHIRRHDYLVNLWQNAVEALLFYHPAVWWVSRHMRAEREFCCDDLAVAASGSALGYACALEKLEAARSRPPALAMAASAGSLLRRIARLLEPSRGNSPAGPGLAAPVILAGAMLLCLAGLHSWGQAAPARHFDVVSIKPFIPTGPYARRYHADPAGAVWTATTLKNLICDAYVVDPWTCAYAVRIKGPSWIDSDLYHVEVRTGGPWTDDEFRQMLQSALVDRFHLVVERTQQPRPVYLLTSGSRVKLQPATRTDKCGQVTLRPGKIAADCLTMDDLVDAIGNAVQDRPILNRTGLPKEQGYQISLDFATGQPDDAGPSIFTAVQEQLGLKLVPATAPIAIIVVHGAQRPQPN